MRGTTRGKVESILAVLFLIAKQQLNLPWWTLLFPLGVFLLDIFISRCVLYRRRRAAEQGEQQAKRTPKSSAVPPSSRKERLKTYWSRFRLFVALTSPIWIIALLGEGSLLQRLIGVVVVLVVLGTTLFPMLLLFGFLIALGERRAEKEKGELEDAKKY